MSTRRHRVKAWILTTGWLAFIWILLWGQLSWANVIGGVCVGIVVTLVFPLPRLDFAVHIRPIPMLAFLFHMAKDLVISSVIVAYLGIVRGPATKGAVIKVRLHTHNDLYVTWIAQALSLVPGSLIIEARRDTGDLYVHILGVKSQADLDKQRARIYELERRLMRAVATDAELSTCMRETEHNVRSEGGVA